MKETKNYLAIIGVTILARVLYYLFYARDTFNNSIIPYPLDADSWYYYNLYSFIPKFVLVLVPLIAICIASVYFYKILKELNISYAYEYSLLFAMFYPIIIQSFIGYVDTPPIILMCTLGLVYCMFKKPYGYGDLSLNFLIAGILLILWEGGAYLIAFLYITLLLSFIGYYGDKKVRVIILFLGTIISTPIIYKYISFFIDRTLLVGELQPNFNPVFLIFLIFYLALLFDNLNISKFTFKEFYFICLSIIFGAGSFFQQRWSYLGVTFMVIAILIMMDKTRSKLFSILNKTLHLIVLIGIFVGFITFYNADSLVGDDEDNYIALRENMDSFGYDTVIGSWAYGHLYDYYLDNVTYKAHPQKDSLYVTKVLKNESVPNAVNIVNKYHLDKYNISLNCSMSYECYSFKAWFC